MKKQIKSLEEIYGKQLSLAFVEQLYETSLSAYSKVKTNLAHLTEESTTSKQVTTCVKAEQFWLLLRDECLAWLTAYKKDM